MYIIALNINLADRLWFFSKFFNLNILISPSYAHEKYSITFKKLQM